MYTTSLVHLSNFFLAAHCLLPLFHHHRILFIFEFRRLSSTTANKFNFYSSTHSLTTQQLAGLPACEMAWSS